jgi:hypothetical protein
MTTYTTITNGQVDLDSPVTQTLMTALRDNPLAIAEQTSGAPPVGGVWHFYNETTFGAGDGVIWDFATDGVVASVETPTFTTGYEYRIIGTGVDHNDGGTQTIQCALFQATSASYTTGENVTAGFGGSSNASGFADFDVLIPYPENIKNLLSMRFTSWVYNSAGATEQDAAAAIYTATAQAVSKARITATAGSLSAGTIYLLRRRVSF